MNGQDNISNMTIDDICLSVRTYNALKRHGVLNLEELSKYTIEDFLKLRNMGITSANEIYNAIRNIDGNMIINENSYDEDNIETLDLSVRSYNALTRAGYKLISELCELTIEEIMGIKNLGAKSGTEIISKLEERGIFLEKEREIYFEREELPDYIVEYNLIKVVSFLEEVFKARVYINFDEIDKSEFLRRFENFLNTIKQREKRIMILRFGLIDGVNKTLEETAYEFGITRERVRQIENKSLVKLGEITRSKRIREYIKLRKVENEDISDYILKCVFDEI